MTKKQEEDYEDEIRTLNSVLLEMKDQANALGHERDRWKELAILLMNKLGIKFSEGEQLEKLIERL